MESNTVEPAAGDAQDETQTASYVGGPDSPRRLPKSKADLPAPGEQFGNYRLIRKLGEGGMGVVFEAVDLNGERQVALKLLAHSLESPEARNRFFREGRLAASINHPNSVYVFGTEEIDGTPAISMEHISGGTLQDRVRNDGPLPVSEAVDVILQIIAGLEAAALVGVLHRDIKPSNCFVDAYGTVKIGDFGLSISTEVRGDSYLTEPGSFLGTPAFSSPEQLRGDELDIRSDIYAVGVTLYYLLTGKTPFAADNLVKLLATVLEQPATSPAMARSDIPNGLARIVLRCLAKQPADRFATYADLRDALVPYDSSAPTPATLALRALAGFCDLFLLNIVSLALQFAWFRDFAAMADPAWMRSREFIATMCVAIMLQVFYFAVPEGLRGVSLGKAICGLRVVDRQRGNIGLRRAFVRTIIYVTFPGLILWSYWIFNGVSPFDFERRMNDPNSYWVFMSVSNSYYVMLALLFSTARRRNGYSGLHDLATGSRVILRTASARRPTIDCAEPPLSEPKVRQTIGPYHVLDSLQQAESEEFLLAYDTRLLRRVWLHRWSDGAPSMAPALRNLGRVGRLRWINGSRTSGECWDAYEALSGQPLLKLTSQPQPWNIVRYWLMDLACEISVAEQDGTMPERLALDRVWITADGRAKLLDFSAPGTDSPGDAIESASAAAATLKSSQRFLFHVAATALQGRIVGPQETSLAEAAVRLPVKARLLIDRLAAGAATPAEAATEFRAMTSGTPSVTRLRRAAMLMTVCLVPSLIAVVASFGWLMINNLNEQRPDVVRLRSCLMYMDAANDTRAFLPRDNGGTSTTDETRRAFEIYIAGTFRETIEDPQSWNSLTARTIPLAQRAQAQQIIATYPQPAEPALREAAAVVEPVLSGLEKSVENMNQQLSPLAIGLIQFETFWILFVAVPGMIAAMAFRRGLVLRMFGVDYVARNGSPASRLRMFWRSIVFHSPVFLAPILLAFLLPLLRHLTLSLLLIGGLALTLSILSSLLPERGISARISGLYLVPL